jgi:hypothetical protein
MSVWYAIPSKRPVNEAMQVLDKWLKAGYRVAVLRDWDDPELPVHKNIRFPEYQGYGASVNYLMRWVLSEDPYCNWVVTGGDDYEPDSTIDPEKVAGECSEHFRSTFGVMQPTGDRWMLDENGTGASERVCDAPWIGREFALRMYGGFGPYYPYRHFYVDEELHEVATKLGVLWHRPDIKQVHNHWCRNGGIQPPFLMNHNWDAARTLFESRKAEGFPGHEPAPIRVSSIT